jgi:hypothetical protein
LDTLNSPCPAAEPADHVRVKRTVALAVERVAHIVAFGQQDLGDERHPCSERKGPSPQGERIKKSSVLCGFLQHTSIAL